MTGRMVDEPTFSRTKAPDESPDRRLSRQRQQFVRSVGGLKTPTPDECPAPPTPPDERQQTTRPFNAETNVRCSAYHSHQASHRREGKGWTCDICNPPTERNRA